LLYSFFEGLDAGIDPLVDYIMSSLRSSGIEGRTYRMTDDEIIISDLESISYILLRHQFETDNIVSELSTEQEASKRIFGENIKKDRRIYVLSEYEKYSCPNLPHIVQYFDMIITPD
jgi:adenine-specific DNA methylase